MVIVMLRQAIAARRLWPVPVRVMPTEVPLSYHAANTIFCPLLMDMQPTREAGIKGKLTTPYLEHMAAVRDLRDRYSGKMLPFVARDPRRPDMFHKVFLTAFSPENNFFGVKICPSLAYLPSHPRLMEVFEICQQKSIPVTTHCSGALVRSSYKRLKNIKGPSWGWRARRGTCSWSSA